MYGLSVPGSGYLTVREDSVFSWAGDQLSLSLTLTTLATQGLLYWQGSYLPPSQGSFLAVGVRGGAPVAEVSSLTPGEIVSVSLPSVVASDGQPLTLNITVTAAGNLTLSARGEAASSAVQLGEPPASPVYIGGLPPGHSMAATYPSFRGCIHTLLVTTAASSRYLTFADTEAGERSEVRPGLL